MAELARQLQDYRLTTAEIVYRMPDHLSLLQTFVWQDYDIAPQFPELHRFLDFWERELDGPLYAVKVASAEVITPADHRFAEVLQTLH